MKRQSIQNLGLSLSAKAVNHLLNEQSYTAEDLAYAFCCSTETLCENLHSIKFLRSPNKTDATFSGLDFQTILLFTYLNGGSTFSLSKTGQVSWRRGMTITKTFEKIKPPKILANLKELTKIPSITFIMKNTAQDFLYSKVSIPLGMKMIGAFLGDIRCLKKEYDLFPNKAEYFPVYVKYLKFPISTFNFGAILDSTKLTLGRSFLNDDQKREELFKRKQSTPMVRLDENQPIAKQLMKALIGV